MPRLRGSLSLRFSDAALAFLIRVRRLGRAFVPRLEPQHLELIKEGLVGYVPHSKGYWIYDKAAREAPNDK